MQRDGVTNGLSVEISVKYLPLLRVVMEKKRSHLKTKDKEVIKGVDKFIIHCSSAAVHPLFRTTEHDTLFLLLCVCGFHVTSSQQNKRSVISSFCSSTSNKQFSRWRHLTTTTTIQFVFLFIFKFCIPSGVKITITLINMTQAKPEGFWYL